MIVKYINILKKSIVFLLIMLIIVSLSFSMTYSNFIYKSDSHRAVEMFASKLDYQLIINDKVTNEYNLNPGNNLLHVEIKSLNEVDSFYKLVYKCENVYSYYFNKNDNNIIKSNDSVKFDISIYNKMSTKQSIVFEVFGGYVTNKIEDVKVTNDYKTISNEISVGNVITLNDLTFRLLDILNDGSYVLLSDNYQEKTLNGADGYNHVITSFNNLNAPINSITYRSVNLSDIRKYVKNSLIEYESNGYFSDSYYPSLWKVEDSIINNIRYDSPLSREEEESVITNKEFANSITVKGLVANNIEFINEKYEDIFLNSDYLLATRSNTITDTTAKWGILSINDKKIELKELFESNNSEYEISGYIRIYAVINSNEDLFNKSL